jgi:colicin import membrane protein
MKKVATVLVGIVALVFAASCAKKATPEECKKVCEVQVTLTKAANPQPPAEDVVAKVEADFQKKLQDLQTAQAQAIQAIDQEMQGKLTAADVKEEDKPKITEEYNGKKTAKAQEFAPQFQALNQAKGEAIKAAQDAKAKADADAKAAAEKALAACADKCVKDRTTKAKADCQTKAAKLDDFNKCK